MKQMVIPSDYIDKLDRMYWVKDEYRVLVNKHQRAVWMLDERVGDLYIYREVK